MHFCENLESKFKELVQDLHLLMVLFGTNIVRNVRTKAQKITISNAQFALLWFKEPQTFTPNLVGYSDDHI